MGNAFLAKIPPSTLTIEHVPHLLYKLARVLLDTARDAYA
jgi:hypothetical protein